MKFLAVVSIVLAAAFTAFAAGGRGAGSVASQRVPAWCKPVVQGAPGVGLKLSAQVYINGAVAPTSVFPLAAGGVLTTTNSAIAGYGHVQFCLKPKSTVCNTWKGARVELVLSNPIARFRSGLSQCSTSLLGSMNYGTGGGKTQLTVSDPLWSMSVTAKSTKVGVAVGFISVSGKSGSEKSVIIGPGQQVVVPEGGDPGQPQPFKPTAADLAGFAFLRPFLPVQNFAPPPPGDSPELQLIFKRRLISVGYDAKQASSQVVSFAKLYFGQLAARWKIKLKLSPVSSAQARELLAARRINLFVGPAPPSADVFPFFTTPPPASVVWRFGDDSDDAFDSAMVGFLRATLNTGLYATLFQKSFRVAPDYSALRSILFTT